MTREDAINAGWDLPTVGEPKTAQAEQQSKPAARADYKFCPRCSRKRLLILDYSPLHKHCKQCERVLGHIASKPTISHRNDAGGEWAGPVMQYKSTSIRYASIKMRGNRGATEFDDEWSLGRFATECALADWPDLPSRCIMGSSR